MSDSNQTADEAELAYYKAFRTLDTEAMRQVWLDSNEVYCIHPAGDVQSGFQRVIASWALIFDRADAPEVTIRVLQRTENEGVAIHLVEEQIGQGESSAIVLATNVYRKTTHGWRMLSHHGGLAPRKPVEAQQKPSVH